MSEATSYAKSSDLRRKISNHVTRLKNRIVALSHLPKAEKLYRSLKQTPEYLGFEEMAKVCRQEFKGNVAGYKYIENSSVYWRENLARVLQFNLYKSKPLRILDLGCGPGYFLFCCRSFGHTVEGLDVPDNLLYDRLFEFYKIPRITVPIIAFEPLPLDANARYDFIGAYSVTFDQYFFESKNWEQKEWDYFLENLSTHLVQGGKFALRINLNRYENLHVKDIRPLVDAVNSSEKYEMEIQNHRDMILHRK